MLETLKVSLFVERVEAKEYTIRAWIRSVACLATICVGNTREGHIRVTTLNSYFCKMRRTKKLPHHLWGKISEAIEPGTLQLPLAQLLICPKAISGLCPWCAGRRQGLFTRDPRQQLRISPAAFDAIDKGTVGGCVHSAPGF